MIFEETPLKGAWLISPELRSDERGLFSRLWCVEEARIRELEDRFVQNSTSFNKSKGTLRGMHFQRNPHEEIKLVRCTAGTIFDVIVDIRANSKTFGQWFGIELSSENRKQIYIPKGFAHGFQTLEDKSEVYYQITEYYHPECADGFSYHDENINIQWPEKIFNLSEIDKMRPELKF